MRVSITGYHTKWLEAEGVSTYFLPSLSGDLRLTKKLLFTLLPNVVLHPSKVSMLLHALSDSSLRWCCMTMNPIV